ncbi:hypothetical protein ACFQJ5_04120 [Halomicroarcula sp. GCM10025324]|uniref:hypothetical protein n=1 Tax=Haloarcula TaxID=2237 RepID=UPI0023E7A38E|nr:hypothetical protein [Halomicroarcula sp. ZS-22-S1]
MATSVKIDEETKDLLERLQAEIKLETGTSVTQQELLDRIVRREFESKAELIDSFDAEWDGLSPAETETWLAGTAASGRPVEEDDIDDVLAREVLDE